MFGRKRAAEEPVRKPHPDPRIETQLQRILSLRQSAARKEDLCRQYAAEVDRLSRDYRYQIRNSFGNDTSKIEKRIVGLQGELRQLEQEIDGIHEDIAKRAGELTDTDLSYL